MMVVNYFRMSAVEGQYASNDADMLIATLLLLYL